MGNGRHPKVGDLTERERLFIEASVATGAPWWAVQEAIASTALDKGDGETASLSHTKYLKDE